MEHFVNNTEYNKIGLLRFTTAGSVDDGKSTLIGRLLYDSKAIFQDQLDAIEESSKRKGEEEINLALLTDGLRAEREQGITIDVAYRYFATPKRKFIIADTPGHVQYTRNMVTGASTANLAILLVDARHGVIEQTRRHAYIASLLNIPHIIVCVNKMDLVDFDQVTFEKIKYDFIDTAKKMKINDVHFIPICATDGDNLVSLSKRTPWYEGQSLMDLLENIKIAYDQNHEDPRFNVQYVIRPQSDEFHDYRGYAGRISGGSFQVGQKVKVYPSGHESIIKTIDVFKKQLNEAHVGESVSITLEDDIDISRGYMISDAENTPQTSQDIELMVSWFNERPLQVRGKYVIRHNTNEIRGLVKSVDFKVNINTLEHDTEDKNIQMNDIAKISIKTTQPIFFDSYKRNRNTGSLVFIDEATNETVGVGMIL